MMSYGCDIVIHVLVFYLSVADLEGGGRAGSGRPTDAVTVLLLSDNRKTCTSELLPPAAFLQL